MCPQKTLAVSKRYERLARRLCWIPLDHSIPVKPLRWYLDDEGFANIARFSQCGGKKMSILSSVYLNHFSCRQKWEFRPHH